MGKPMSTVYVPDEYGRLVPTQVPTWIGFIGWYAGLEPPEGYLYCDGSAIGRETYKELFDAIGTLYGAGDGSTTFNILDLRGLFVRGDGGNAAALAKALETLAGVIRDANGLPGKLDKERIADMRARRKLERQKAGLYRKDEDGGGVVLLPQVEEKADAGGMETAAQAGAVHGQAGV